MVVAFLCSLFIFKRGGGGGEKGSRKGEQKRGAEKGSRKGEQKRGAEKGSRKGEQLWLLFTLWQN